MATRAEHLARLQLRFGYAFDELDDAEEDVQTAYLYWLDNDDRLALNFVIQSAANLVDCVQYIMDKNYPTGGQYSIINFLNLHTAGGEEYQLTLIKFIEAYINADDDHRSAHRLLLDAYQASMYDKPFDMEYHKNWVARFRQWR